MRRREAVGRLMAGAVVIFSAILAMAVPLARAEACPASTELSPGFRSYLPDCRAYEMVTPPAKNGEPPVTDASSIAPNGSAFAFTSVGAFNDPEGDSTSEGGEYVAARGVGAWTSSPVNPSSTEFQVGSPENESTSHETLDFSSDLSKTLFLKPRVGAKPIDSRFYIRDTATGAYTEVGALLPPETVAAWTPQVADARDFPPTKYSGATAGFSHIFFEQLGGSAPMEWLWPGDKSLRSWSLYEYSYPGDPRTEPELVGVRNKTSLAQAAAEQHKAHINEAAEQIGQCGTFIGGVLSSSEPHVSEAYNALSQGGETTFFTALKGGCESRGRTGTGPTVNEIYARVDRDHTIAISEPSTGAGGDCEQCDESEPRRAVFQGASADGRRAFFISEQKMFAGANGEAGTNLYEYDVGGPAGHKVREIASELPNSAGEPGGVVRVTENGAFVYFVSQAVLATNHGAENSTASTGQDNLYVFGTEQATTRFIAQLSSEDQADWNGVDNRPAEATPDGRFLLFPSATDLTPDAAGSGRQLYRYQVPGPGQESGSIMRINVGAKGEYECPQTKEATEGFNCDGNAIEPPGSVFSPTYQRLSTPDYRDKDQAKAAGVSMSSDGSQIVFASPAALVPGAINDTCAFEAFGACESAAENIYEWRDGKLGLISDGIDSHSLFHSSSTRLIGMNSAASDIFFTSADPLVPQDGDTQVDVYGARVDGGFPEPLGLTGCEGEGCQGSPSPAPVFETPGSSGFAGAGNLAPPPPPPPKPAPRPPKCRKGERKVDGKCLVACRKTQKRVKGRCKPACVRRSKKGRVTKCHAAKKSGHDAGQKRGRAARTARKGGQ